MKYQRLFETVAERTAALANAHINILSYTKGTGGGVDIYTYTPNPPSNLTISCSNNTVTITATNATSIQYSLDQTPYKVYTAYTEPFTISQTITVYAKAINSDGEIEASQECVYTNPTTTPFYIEDVSGNSNTVQITKSDSSAPTLTIQKSTDGTTWESMGTTSTTAITATVPANGKLYLRCNTNIWCDADYFAYNVINTTGNCNIGGNIMSLLYGVGFTGNETTFPSGSISTFMYLFSNATHIVNGGNLLLPATTLVDYCYQSMFGSCTSLTAAPALPATTLAQSCYSNMFYSCTGLTTAPELPATTLTPYCYNGMFYHCTSLTTAPALPATTLAEGCYQYMFQNCTNLHYIKCLATNISASQCTIAWVYDVAATGTFVKDPNMSNWTTGVNGIPTGWTVRNPSGIQLSQALNVATIEITNLDSGTGYYTINGGSHISLSEGTTTVAITQAMNGQTLLVYGEFDSEPIQQTLTLSWTDYSPAVTITETDNYVTITSATADSITYRLGSSGEYTTYTAPVYIASDTTIYVIATKTVSGVVYTTNESQAVTHTVIPPSNLTITCLNNTVTITADNATTLEYNTNGSSTYTTYTAPFAITETVTVYARATNADGSITASQECVYTSYGIPFYIEDVSGSSNTVSITKNNSNAPTLTIQKSTDGTTWESMGTTSTTAITATIPANGKLYLRCNVNHWGSYYNGNYYRNTINTTGNCNVGGNIMSLLYGSSFTGNETTFPSTGYEFYALFFNAPNIINANDLLLPALTVNTNSYAHMFHNSTSLTTAPTTLPATTLAQSCYDSMFQGCTSLTTAPALPATTLANNCYLNMFSGCTNLNYIKCLATDISASACTIHWVQGVAANGTFVKDPNMSTSTWGTGTSGIPTGWVVGTPSSIVISQQLNVVIIIATDLDTGTGYYTINGGSHISLSEGTTTVTITQAMNGQTLLVYGEFDGEPEQQTVTLSWVNPTTLPFYIEDVSGSSNTVSITKNNSDNPTLTIQKSTDGTTWESMGTTSTTAITATIPANGKLYLRCNTSMWNQNKINTTGNCNVGGNIMSLLYGNNFTGNETSFPSGSTYTFYSLFNNNTHIINATNLLLPATTLAQSCYSNMFYSCTGLTTAPELPATTLTPYCYNGMFYHCTSLTTAPVFPATTLVNNCYYYMFYGCTNLNYIQCLATNISASQCTNYWVQNVAASGTFVKDATMSSWTTGINGIPNGWTTQNQKGITMSQDSNVATIEVSNLDTGTGYYTINGGSHISLSEGTTTVAITQAMDGQTLFAHGEFDGEVIEKTLTLDWVDYSPSVTITETDNFVTITSATADSITYRLGSSGEYTTYTTPVYIASDTTIYVIATKTVSGVVYTTNESQAVTHTVIPPSNLVISCSNNTVTITATNAQTIEYNTNGSSTYTTYTAPFEITETVTVYARATNADGSITASQECVYSGYIGELISMGCKFWAPLTENDITEQLSETAPTHRAGQLTWDSTKNAYKFKTTADGQQVLVYNIPGVNNLSSTLAYTLIADIWCVSNSGTVDFYTCGQTATSDTSVSCSTAETHRFSGFTNGSWHRLVQTVNGNTLKMYIDGTCVRTDTDTSNYRMCRPATWTTNDMRNYTTIGNVWSSYKFEAYIKNVYLFDHELTTSEINSLRYN